MTTLVEDAIRVLRDLPENLQSSAARAILELGAGDDELLLSDAQVAEVERRVANPDRDFLSIEQVRDRLRPFKV